MKIEINFDTNNTTVQALDNLFPNGWGYNGVELNVVSDPECTKEEIDAEISKFQADYATQEYARNRQREYPTIGELTVALYDTDDKAALETKRAAIKTKWPKDNSGPVE